MVCTNCKRRKSKCDRLKPVCGNCLRLGDQSTCLYVSNPISPQTSTPPLISQCFEEYHEEPPTLINLVPYGHNINAKRSATTYIAPLTTAAIRQRDPYLQILDFVSGVPRKRAIIKSSAKEEDSQKESLPTSMRIIKKLDKLTATKQLDPATSSFIQKHESMYRSLFDKFAQCRRNHSWEVDEKLLPGPHFPKKDVFLRYVWPHFEIHISKLLPIFNNDVLRFEIEQLYKSWEESQKLNVKHNDYTVYSIVLLITSISQLSVKFAHRRGKTAPSKPETIILEINTQKYIAIVNHFILQCKIFRKITVLQLQCLLLLRVYHWCAPDDGDGELLQQSIVLMGTIIGGCRDTGVGWLCFKDPSHFTAEVHPGSRPSMDQMGTDGYIDIYRRIWSFVLHWDRKLSILTGQECFIGKTIKFQNIDTDSWHMKLMVVDHLMFKIANSISDSPHQVDLEKTTKLFEDLSRSVKDILHKDETDYHFYFETYIVLTVSEISVYHAYLVQCETTGNVEDFQDCIQYLFEKILKLSKLCYEYLEGDPELDPYTNFYTNKIVDVALTNLCQILPAIIIRCGRATDKRTKSILLKFYYNLSSMYFNELGVNYYQVFRRMFSTKLTYTTLAVSNQDDSWKPILEFLQSPHFVAEKSSCVKRPLLDQFLEAYKSNDDDKDVVKLWTDIYSGGSNLSFDLDLESHENDLRLFMENQYSDYNVFAAFCHKVSTKFIEHAKENPSVITEDESLLGGLPNVDLNILSDFNGMGDFAEFLTFFEENETPNQPSKAEIVDGLLNDSI